MEEAMFLVRMNVGSTYEKHSMKNNTSFHHKPKAQPQSPPWATSLHTAHCLCCDAPYLPKSAAHFSSPSVSTGCPCAPPLAAALSPCCSFGLPLISVPPRVCGAILSAAKQAQMFPYYKASSEPAHFNDVVHRFIVLQTRGVEQAMAPGWKQGYCPGTHLSWAQIMPANPSCVNKESKHFLPSKRFPEPHLHLQYKCT